MGARSVEYLWEFNSIQDISTSRHVSFCLLYKLITTFLTISRRFPTTSRKSPKLSQGHTSISEYLPNRCMAIVPSLNLPSYSFVSHLCRPSLYTSWHRPGPVCPRVLPNVGWPLNNNINNLQLTFSALGPTKKCKNLENAPWAIRCLQVIRFWKRRKYRRGSRQNLVTTLL